MSYTDEDGVYSTTQFNSDILQTVLEIGAPDVTTWVTARIARAQNRVREDIGLPYVIRNELYIAKGYSNIFELGDSDDPSSNFQMTEVVDNLDAVKRVQFGTYRKLLSYPTDCDAYTEILTGWSGTNATISTETAIIGAGSGSVKAIMSDAGYIQYPDTTYLDTMINQYPDNFFWFRTTSLSNTYTIRLYNTDGDYYEQTFAPRYVNQGQYMWIDLSAMTNVGAVDWGVDRFQYFRIYTSGACTMYVDNWCLADSWAYSAPQGLFHVAKSDNVSSDSYPSAGFPYKITYTYDPFLSSTPAHIAEATEWLTGIYILDALRTRKYGDTDFMLWADTMEQDIPQQGSGLLAVRRYMMEQYKDQLVRYGGESWGYIQ